MDELIGDFVVKIGGPISEERQKILRDDYIAEGWKIDTDDENELAFSYLEDEKHECYLFMIRKLEDAYK